jgi:hypothetical protein
MSMRSHFVPPHRFVGRAHRTHDIRVRSATDVHARLSGILLAGGGLGIVAGVWGGLAPFVGPTFGYTADGGGSWHWDLARAILAALPGSAAVVAGMLVVACARSTALAIGKGGVMLAGAVMFASGAWFAIGPSAWPLLWSQGYLIHSGAMADFGRTAGFAAGPGVVLAALAGVMAGSVILRDRGRLVTDEMEMPSPVDVVGTHTAALNADDEDTAIE